MKKTTISAIAAVAVLASLSANATVIFQDTFNGIPAGGVWDNLNDPVTGWAARQAGGTTTSTYTLGLNGGTTLIGPAAQTAGMPEPVLVRVNITGGGAVGGEATLDLDADFGSSLAGTQWTLGYTGRFLSSVGVSGWTGFGVGNPAETPIAAGTALGLNVFASGAAQVWANGVLVGSPVIPNPISGQVYTMVTTFDEIAGTAQITYTDGLSGAFDMGTYAVSFVDASRFVELKNFVSTGTGDGIADWRVDDLTIETIPEPATLGLMAMLGGGMLWCRKRFSR